MWVRTTVSPPLPPPSLPPPQYCGCDCSISMQPTKSGWCWSWRRVHWVWAWDEAEGPCDMRGFGGFACGESADMNCIASWMDCLWKSCQFCRGILLVNLFSHWKKLALSLSRSVITTWLAWLTRWLADSFITSMIWLKLDGFSSLFVSLHFLGLCKGRGEVRTGILVGVSFLELELLSCPWSSWSGSWS